MDKTLLGAGAKDFRGLNRVKGGKAIIKYTYTTIESFI